MPIPPKNSVLGMVVEYVPLLLSEDWSMGLEEVDEDGNPIEGEIEMMLLNKNSVADRDTNRQIRSANRLWGVL